MAEEVDFSFNDLVTQRAGMSFKSISSWQSVLGKKPYEKTVFPLSFDAPDCVQVWLLDGSNEAVEYVFVAFQFQVISSHFFVEQNSVDVHSFEIDFKLHVVFDVK